MKILVTGGAGYIGSHTCVEFLSAGHEIVVVDNLRNSKIEALRRVEAISGKRLEFVKLDLRDHTALNSLFDRFAFDAVVHFAGLKAVGESVQFPLEYYDNNVGGSLSLFRAMLAHGVKKLVFSSSATVYGGPQQMPIREDFPIAPLNPYGQSKAMIEQILRDLAAAQPDWQVTLLRYFNPVGAHPSGRIGEDPNDIPNNLFPYITQVIVGRLPYLRVFGNDYPTPDGTGIRDYIHVVDLARGHVCALEKLEKPGVYTYNLGTGRGYSVLEVLSAFERACGRTIPYRVVERRPGDAPVSYADPGRAHAELGWRAEYSLDDMCRHSWNWQSQNPQGYQDETP